MKRLPVGVDDFRDIRSNYYFIDKTFFIKDLLDSGGKVTLITRPRRFGKTLTMSMLYYFFSNQNAAENRVLFDGTAIAQIGDEYMAAQGGYPTVFVSLKALDALEYESAVNLLALKLQDLFKNYRYLLDSEKLSADEKELFSRVLCNKATVDELQPALKRLTEYLSRHHRKNVILLIDEYDVMIQSAWEHGYYDKAITFMRNFLSEALKTNPSLEFAVLTGVLRVAKESIFSALNNLEVSSVVRGHYANVFGFTPPEVEKLAADLGRSEKMAEVREWYDGYTFSGQEIYNPWSVINYFAQNCDAEAYWVNTSANGILKTMLFELDEGRRREIMTLRAGQPVLAEIKEGLIYADIHKDRDALYTMLLTTGYLKCIAYLKIHNKPWAKLNIPNLEVQTVFDSEILQNAAVGLGSSTLYLMMEAMLAGQTDTFAYYLEKILKETVSTHDAAHPESFYHGMMLGFSVLLCDTYAVESNRESGYGRFDLALIPKNPGQTGVVMEFKKAASEEELDAKAKEALAQIDAKEYITALQQRGCRAIWRYGIAFCGKRVQLAEAH